MVMTDTEIHHSLASGRISVNPLELDNIQPASIDLRLSPLIRTINKTAHSQIDLRNVPENYLEDVIIDPDHPFVIHPSEFALGSTQEFVTLSPSTVARIEGKSSLGRVGLIVHCTAGYIDPGWKGTITLELGNNGPLPILLYADMLIAQITFMATRYPATRPYGHPDLKSRYQGQTQTTGSRYSI